MPMIFNENNKETYRVRLLENGMALLRQGGVKAVTVEAVTKRSGLAKGTFYTFFPSKEEFIYQIILHNRNKSKSDYAQLADRSTPLGREEIRQYFLTLLLSENNVYSYLSEEDHA